MNAYIQGLQAQLDALNAQRAPLLALVASEEFAALSDREKQGHHFDNNMAAAQAASLEARILAASGLG
jgi:hypothetical protein